MSLVRVKNFQLINVITAELNPNIFLALRFGEINKLKPQIGAMSRTQVFNYLFVVIIIVM